MKTIATNLSEGGMAIQFERTVLKGAIAKVQFRLPATQISMEPTGEVAWSDGLGRAGIKFVEVPESSRAQLEKWILRRIEAQTAIS